MAGLGLSLRGVPVPPFQVAKGLLHLSFPKFLRHAFPDLGGQPTPISLQRCFHLTLHPPRSGLSNSPAAHEGGAFGNQPPCPLAYRVLSRRPSWFGVDALGC